MSSASVQCSFCGNNDLKDVIDFGDVALAGGFLKPERFATERKFPLRICFCPQCFAVQVAEKIDPEILFTDYFYFSSAIQTLKDHFVTYASDVVARFLPKPQEATVVEIGCNDGVLLRPLAHQGIGTVVGVDPAKNVVETINDERVKIVNDFFGVSVAERMKSEFGPADLILANNVFAHIEDINGVTEGVEKLLKDDGVFVFEVHYLGKIIEELQYDFIYHEHLFYYSLIALENHLARHGMLVFDILPVEIHGGSLRYYACKKGSSRAKNISQSVVDLRNKELSLGYDSIGAYERFAAACADRRNKLMSLLNELKGGGKTIVGYGASGRANTIIQYCGINEAHLSGVIDDAPAKQGFFTPGSHLHIVGRDVLESNPPDYILVFAWPFFKEIAAKCSSYIEQGGRLIVPLPQVRIFPDAPESFDD